MNSKKTGTWVATYGMLISLAFIFSYLEAMIPIPMPVPGVKLGLANLVTIVGLYTVGIRGTVAVSLIRIVLVGFTFGNTSSMIYSLARTIVNQRNSKFTSYDFVSSNELVQPSGSQYYWRDWS